MDDDALKLEAMQKRHRRLEDQLDRKLHDDKMKADILLELRSKNKRYSLNLVRKKILGLPLKSKERKAVRLLFSLKPVHERDLIREIDRNDMKSFFYRLNKKLKGHAVVKGWGKKMGKTRENGRYFRLILADAQGIS